MRDADTIHMRHALALGARGLGRVWPNPAVGCVIEKNNRIVGRGWTQDGGRPHAEAVALAQAGDRAKGATVYVTLEPCSHDGETPPCADALIKAGVSRVVVAAKDPDERVNGRGLALLSDAGIDVETGILTAEATRQHIGFMTKAALDRPMVTLKLASSFDGRIATAKGESQWITGPHARRLVHAQRASHDAVMVGGGTARSDDPMLDVRGLGVSHQPVRVVWSSNLDLPLQGKLAQSAKDIPVWILHGPNADSHLCDAWSGLGARLMSVQLGANQKIDPAAAMSALGQAGLTRIFCEGGGTLSATLISAGLVNELMTFTAGIALGGDAQPMLGALGLNRLDNAPRFDVISYQTVGNDTVTHWQVTP